MTTIKFDDFLQDELKQEDFKAGYLAEKSILESAIAVFNARQNAGLTQRELADLSHVHVPQSTIARIERGHNTSIETMSKIAFALNQKLTINIG
ncbi:helix-turn-helix domain-containing protein [Streptococcus anginosus]|uniref:helix-turn-helix domain-containing protein n=1 Tax=Streptococcus anginosus TaxID=1328 RepID=UPI003562682F